MADVILAGEPGEKLGGIGEALAVHKEAVERIEFEITHPEFIRKIEEFDSGVVISRFQEGDLASIKAMQSLRLKKPFLKFIFISGNEQPASILTLMFNEGAYGILKEPLSRESASQLVKQAIKKSKWDMDEAARNQELRRINETLTMRMERQELEIGRQKDLIDKLERITFFLLSDRQFKPKTIKIMLVSDSAYQRNAMEELFGKLGFTITSVTAAEESLARIKADKPDIVVSDLELPGMSGVDLAKEVKGKKGYPPVYFVILTANEDKVDFILSPETMVDDCVIKPGDSEKIYGVAAKVALGILTL